MVPAKAVSVIGWIHVKEEAADSTHDAVIEKADKKRAG
jgi:hypothetical protein